MNNRIKKKKGLQKIKNEELWDLDFTIAKFIYPRLIKFKDMKRNSHPIDVTEKEWEDILDRIIRAFYMIIQLKGTNSSNNTDNNLIKEGLTLFSLYYLDLWD